MDVLLRSDIFFFITSVAVIVVTVFLVVALWYVVRILRNIKDVSEMVKKEGAFIISDIAGVRVSIRKLVEAMINTVKKKVSGTKKRKAASSRTTKKKEKESDDISNK